MTKNEIALLGCRFFAMYILFSALEVFFNSSISLIVFLGNSSMMSSRQSLFLIVFPGLISAFLYFSTAWLLWVKATKIARLIWPPLEIPEPDFRFSLQEVQTVGFAFIGLVLIVTAIPDLCKIFFYVDFQKGLDAGSTLNFSTQSSIFREIIQIALGIALFFGSRGLSGLLKLVRDLGNK